MPKKVKQKVKAAPKPKPTRKPLSTATQLPQEQPPDPRGVQPVN